jgi:hypothetical protein
MMKKLLLLLALPILAFGQQKDSLRVMQGIRFTSFSMSTQNGLFGPYPELKDYYAQSSGLEYLLELRKGNWRLKADFYGTRLIAGNPFENDSLTGKSSRYESGLMAVDAQEKKALFIPSILELNYQSRLGTVGLGNFALQGSFMNEEHGRMIPSTFSGMYFKKKGLDWTLQASLIGAIAARSTSGFKSVSASLAQYNPGLDTAGSRHDKTEVNAPFAAFLDAQKVVTFKGWYGQSRIESYTVPGVFQTVMFNQKLAKGPSLIHIQYLRQFKLGNGGNSDPNKAYFQQEGSSYFGLKYSHKVDKVDYFLASSYIDGKGKLLFPREWGREYLVTFQGRERQEGMGNTFAMVVGAKGKWTQGKVRHTGGVSTGVYVRPEPTDYKYNKYAMPSNQQTNVWWKQNWRGNTHELLSMAVIKVPLSSLPISAGQTINKVDMLHLSLVYRYTLMPFKGL